MKDLNSVEYLGMQFDGDNAGSVIVKSMSSESEIQASHDNGERALGIVKLPKDGSIELEGEYSGKVEGYQMMVK